MGSAWTSLILAGLCEVAWPVGLKIAQSPGRAAAGIPLAVVGMAVSGWLLYVAQKQIPIGTAYTVWTGIGAAGTFVLGVLVYGDGLGLVRILGVALIVLGVVTLKLGH
jgi:quaternary ammonium compound-resistance protein SugE